MALFTKTRADLATDLLALFPDNNTAQITPSVARGLIQEFIDNLSNGKDDNPFLAGILNAGLLLIGGLITANGGIKVGAGTTLLKLMAASGSLSFPSTLNGATGDSTATIAVTGAAVGDVVEIGIPVVNQVAGLTYIGFVSSTGNVTIRCTNNSGGTLTPTTGTFKVIVKQF